MSVRHSIEFDYVLCLILRYIVLEITNPLLYVTNECLPHGIFPDRLKISKIISGKNGSHELMDNYHCRGISKHLKIVIVNDRLITDVTKN